MAETNQIPIQPVREDEKVVLLHKEAHIVNLNADKAPDGAEICVIRCDGGSEIGVFAFKSGALAVKDYNNNAFRRLKPGEDVQYNKDGSFSEVHSKGDDQRLVTISNRLAKRAITNTRIHSTHIVGVDSNPGVPTHLRTDKKLLVKT